MSGKADVVVIGGGVIGVATALELARRGAAVSLVEKGEIGHGCSYGNAGWITPCFARPLPAPGVLGDGLRWLFDPESPLRIPPRASLALASWLLRFAAATTRRRYERGCEALIALSRASLGIYADWSRTLPDDFGFRQHGLLALCETRQELDHLRLDLEFLRRFDIAGRALPEDEARALEPAVTGRIAGAVLYPDEANAEPLAVVRAMAAEAARRGARILPQTEVFAFRIDGSRLAAIRTTHGWIEAERFVLATGAWSKSLGARLGLKLPVLGAKGYAVIAPPLAVPLGRPLEIAERKIAITPRAASVRIAGTLELVDEDWSVTTRRVDAIVKAARALVGLPEPLETREIWRGLRPVTPDGLPILGRAKGFANLFLATGHQMLGLQTAPATGKLVAELVLGESPSFDPTPFRADRF